MKHIFDEVGRWKRSQARTLGGRWLDRRPPAEYEHVCACPQDDVVGLGSTWECSHCWSIWEVDGTDEYRRISSWRKTCLRQKEMG